MLHPKTKFHPLETEKQNSVPRRASEYDPPLPFFPALISSGQVLTFQWLLLNCRVNTSLKCMRQVTLTSEQLFQAVCRLRQMTLHQLDLGHVLKAVCTAVRITGLIPFFNERSDGGTRRATPSPTPPSTFFTRVQSFKTINK